MQKLSLKVNRKGEDLELILEGSLNEETDLSPVPLEGIKSLFIDFNAVTFINSTGINKWVRWTTLLEENYRSISIMFCNCPKIIVDQLNAVKGFLPANAKVESFWLPYYCDESDRREFVLLTRGNEFMEETPEGPEWANLPECNCSETKTPCEPDIMPAKYFAFMKKS